MKLECSKPKISEYDFLELLSSIIIIQKEDLVIKKYELEEKLYDFYDNPDFDFLFEDICKKECVDNKYVDLNIAFQKALTFGLLKMIQDSGDVRFIINISEEEANKFVSKFDLNEVMAMKKLCSELNCDKKTNLTRTLKK